MVEFRVIRSGHAEPFTTIHTLLAKTPLHGPVFMTHTFTHWWRRIRGRLRFSMLFKETWTCRLHQGLNRGLSDPWKMVLTLSHSHPYFGILVCPFRFLLNAFLKIIYFCRNWNVMVFLDLSYLFGWVVIQPRQGKCGFYFNPSSFKIP